MKGLFGYNISEDDQPKIDKGKKISQNPMVTAYGRHPDPLKKCKDCCHLWTKEFARKYYKCDFRGNTNGVGTDHRKHWPACTKYCDTKTKR